MAGEFEKEVQSEIEAGRKETMDRVEATRRETAEAVAKILETSVKQAESVKRQIVGAAELEARNAQLKSLEKAVNEAFEGAMKQVSEVEGAAHEKALARLIQEGLDVIGQRANVACAAKDKRAVMGAVKRLEGKAKVTVEAEPVEAAGGVVLTTPDGSVRFDNTFEARLERMKADLRKEVAAVLTGA
ncbi:MAG TPA: V-type ATP synthase subunit E family protein [Nitrososphaerales archaeon]|nr:V-type ATP synthase subunit E family protein [Nitrososphaerales archaeon]